MGSLSGKTCCSFAWFGVFLSFKNHGFRIDLKGLTNKNVAEAARLTGARQFDVSSGVETLTGVKDIQLISDFIQATNGDT